jgi:DNA-binding Lrp family transcriptional regulator
MTEKATWKDLLPVHSAADNFPMMSEPELRELGEDIKKNGLRERVAVWESEDGQWFLLDGRNRLAALELAGIPLELEIDHDEDDDEDDRSATAWIRRADTGRWISNPAHTKDPDAFVASMNAFRRQLTPEQRQAAIAVLVKAMPEKPDLQIAKKTGASPTTVGKVRKQLEESGDVSTVETRTDTKGRKQPGAKPRRRRARRPVLTTRVITPHPPTDTAMVVPDPVLTSPLAEQIAARADDVAVIRSWLKEVKPGDKNPGAGAACDRVMNEADELRGAAKKLAGEIYLQDVKASEDNPLPDPAPAKEAPAKSTAKKAPAKKGKKATKTTPLYCDKWQHEHTAGAVGERCSQKIKPRGQKHYVECPGKLGTFDTAVKA